jgi:ribonuclease HII
MQTVTVKFNKNSEVTYNVFDSKQLSTEERYAIENAIVLDAETIEDEDEAKVEKEAARLANVKIQNAIFQRASIK